MIVLNVSNKDSQNIVVDIASSLSAFVGDNFVIVLSAIVHRYKTQIVVLEN